MRTSIAETLNWLKRIIGLAVFLILFTFTWACIQLPLLSMHYDDQRVEVGDAVADNFPVLVLTRTADGTHDPWILYLSELAQFQRDQPNHTFLIPEEERRVLWQEVFAWGRDDVDRPAIRARFWAPEFKVESRKPGRQTIMVDARLEGEKDPNFGWYEATADGITPLYHKSYNRDAVGTEALMIGFLANSTFWGVIFLARWDGRRKRRQKAAAKEEALRRAA